MRKAGDRVRITAQLIDGKSGGHIWAERYDRELKDIFAVQDELTQNIVSALKVALTPDERSNLTLRGTDSLQAYDSFMRGREHMLLWTLEAHQRARLFLEQAMVLDPDFADPLACLALIRNTAYLNHWGKDWQSGFDDSFELATKAAALDQQSPHPLYALGIILLWHRKHDEGIEQARRALEIDPNNIGALTGLAMLLHYSGDSLQALSIFEACQKQDPVSDFNFHYLGLCHFMLGDLESAIANLRERIARAPHTDASRALLASTYGHVGKIDEAKAVWSELLALHPGYVFAERRSILPYKNPEDLERIASGLRNAGINA